MFGRFAGWAPSVLMECRVGDLDVLWRDWIYDLIPWED